MPNGQVHHQYFKLGYLVAIPSSLVSAYFDWKFGLGYLVGYSMGRYVDPDWDIMGTNNAEGRMVNELPVLGHFLYGISSTYGSIFRKWHRKWITHLPAVSTAIRLIFVGFIPFLIGDNFGINFIGNGWHMFHLGVWAGLSQADFIHWKLDKDSED